MNPTRILTLAACACLLAGCRQTSDQETAEPAMQHTLQTAPDIWITLFDGSTTEHFRGYMREDLPPAWTIEDGTLALIPGSGEGGDIITKDTFENFELTLEWKISPGGNSGIFYNVVESEDYDTVWKTGPEMQVLDNDAHSDGNIVKHRAGDLYDLVEGSRDATKPVGEWNEVHIVLDHGHLEHWLNGVKIVETQLWTGEWDALVAGSKFADMPGFGKARRGHIALQDHGDRVWYRNIKIRPL